ncbi:MAG: hypothetical protein M3N54_11925 [Acidobacteriota bacterium]|nr:hypothetical protein [Acidobacteriota bacterium]
MTPTGNEPLNPDDYRRELLPSFLDAVRNEFTGQVTVMDRDDRVCQTRFCAGIVACYKPANALETQLAWSIAVDYWRLNRVRGFEEGLFAIAHPNPTGDFGDVSVPHQIANSQTYTFLNRQADFKFLSQYEMRIQRTLNSNKAELKQLQAERPQPQPDRQPDRDGFAFSKPSAAPEPAPAEPPVIHPAKVRTATTTANSESPAKPNGHGFGFSNRSTAIPNASS